MDILKKAVLFGPRLDNAGPGWFSGKIEYLRNKGFDVVGDGKKDLTLKEINTLTKIDPNSRFSIMVHGHEDSGQHKVELGNFNGFQWYWTNAFFTELNKLNSAYPLYIHLFSCQGWTAVNDTTSLSEGSILVTHISDKTVCYGLIPKVLAISTIMKSATRPVFSPFQDFIDNLVDDCLLGCNFAINLNGAVHNHSIKPLLDQKEGRFEKILFDINNAAVEERSQFIDWYKELKLKVSSIGSDNALAKAYFVLEQLSLNSNDDISIKGLEEAYKKLGDPEQDLESFEKWLYLFDKVLVIYTFNNNKIADPDKIVIAALLMKIKDALMHPRWAFASLEKPFQEALKVNDGPPHSQIQFTITPQQRESNSEHVHREYDVIDAVIYLLTHKDETANSIVYLTTGGCEKDEKSPTSGFYLSGEYYWRLCEKILHLNSPSSLHDEHVDL